MEIFYANSSNLVKVTRIRDSETGAALTSITSVSAKLVDADGADVAGSSITLTTVSGETDSRKGYFPSGLTITHNSVGQVVVTVIGVIGATTVTRVGRQNVRFNNGEQD